jgi:hypothetical protein
MKLTEKILNEYDFDKYEDDDLTKLGILTSKAYAKVNDIDKKFVGTPDYMGLAYFWGQAYKHYLRDTSAVKRQQVHKEFLANKLDLTGESDKHQEIVTRVTGKK